MPTDNPKISSYVPQAVYDRFKEYQKDNDLTMSQAVIVILSEYFGLEETLKDTTGSSPIGGVTLSAFQTLVEKFEKLEQEVEYLKSTSKSQQVKQKVDYYSSTSDSNIELTSQELSKRLNITAKTINKIKNKGFEEFTKWTIDKDPDSIPWSFRNDPNKIIYFPQSSSDSNLLSKLQEWIKKNL